MTERVRYQGRRRDQIPKLNRLIEDLRALAAASQRLNHSFGIRIVGYTDDSGSEKVNLTLSRERAQAVRRFLIDNGEAAIAIMSVGMGALAPSGDGADENLRARSRFAGFEVINDAGFGQGNNR